MYSSESYLSQKSSKLGFQTSTSPFDTGGVYFPDAAHADVAASLAEKGFNPNEYKVIYSIESKKAKQDYLRANLETTVNHVFEDSAVSFTNYYQINRRGEIVSSPDGTVLEIDPDERGGLYEMGIRSAIMDALENPGQVVLLYSPPGPVVFDDNPQNKFREVKPYTNGQLYIMYSDGEKVNNVAVGISSKGEPWISSVMPHEYSEATAQNCEIEKVKYFITHPVLTTKTIDSFLETQDFQDRIIYKNKDNITFSLSKTLALIRQSLAGQLVQSPVVTEILQNVDIEHITAHNIDKIYSALAQQYMREKGIDTLTLGGSCGGSEIKFDLFSNGLVNLSTFFRMIAQGKNIPAFVKPNGEDSTITFEFKSGHTCQKCHVDGEAKKLGNCDICEECQKKFDSGEFK